MDEQRSPAQGAAQPGVIALPFRAVLTPHRSLSPRGFLILMSVLATVSFATGLLFASIGAWPVLGFFGLDVGIIYLAFRLNYRAGRLYETVEVLPQTLTINRVHPSGKSEAFEFQSYWARVLLTHAPDGHTVLKVGSHGRAVAFGDFLTDDERSSLAGELRAAIRLTRLPPGH